MKLSLINNSNNNQSFKARLFNYDGTEIQNVKAGRYDYPSYGMVPMIKRGNKNTQIHVLDFISEKYKYISYYSNDIKFKISNPLFGTINNLHYKYTMTDEPIKNSPKLELDAVSELTGYKTMWCEKLEDVALEKYLLNRVKTLLKKNPDADLNPISILDKKIESLKGSHGFSEKRIEKFRQIAYDLFLNIMNKGMTKDSYREMFENGVKNLKVKNKIVTYL